MKNLFIPIFFLTVTIGSYLPRKLNAQELDPTFFVGVRFGDQYSGLTRYQEWAFSQNQGPFESVARNRMIGLDMLYQKNKVPIIINAEFDVKESGRAKPYMYSFALLSGYELVDFPIKISVVGGMGLGFLFLDFGNRTPPDFQNLPYDHRNAMARATLLNAKGGLMAHYKVPLTKKLRPIIYGQAMVNQRMLHSRFRYGEYVTGSDGEEYFDGVKVNIPRFFRNSMSIIIGIAFSF
jgi:hypothetical protein